VTKVAAKIEGFPRYPGAMASILAGGDWITVRHLYQPGFQDQESLSSLVRVHFTIYIQYSRKSVTTTFPSQYYLVYFYFIVISDYIITFILF